jgi:hypothetical protein
MRPYLGCNGRRLAWQLQAKRLFRPVTIILAHAVYNVDWTQSYCSDYIPKIWVILLELDNNN